MHRLLEEAETHPSLLQFYVSRQWINKLENFAEPGNKVILIVACFNAPIFDILLLQHSLKQLVPTNYEVKY